MSGEYRSLFEVLRGKEKELKAATEKGMPALAGVVQQVEAEFKGLCDTHHSRRTVGKVVCLVMTELGYEPTRIQRPLSNAQIFSTATCYRKVA